MSTPEPMSVIDALRLMKAAPKLLAASKATLERLDLRAQMHMSDAYLKAERDQLRAAIAEAEGT